jgi:cytochrome c oxidase cbb3-type subunit 3
MVEYILLVNHYLGFGYLALYGLGNWTGFIGWKSSNQGILNLAESKAQVIAAKENGYLVQYDREIEAADIKYGPIFDGYAARTIEDLATDEEALKVGQRLYLQNCSQCHGSNASGTTGFPNLTDKDWLYGGDPESIKHSLLYGRNANGMIAWGAALGGDQGVKEVTAYVLSLSGREVDVASAAAGKEKFALCASCHGADGKGSLAMGIPLGAPNLTDNIWLYGGSQRAVESSIKNGRAGVMPAWKDILGEQKIHLVSAYVYSLSQ